MLALGVMYIALGVIFDGTYALVAARVGRWVNHQARVFRTGRYAEGGLLLGLGALALALPHQRSAK